MMKRDYSVNEFGVKGSDLKAGMIVRVRWEEEQQTFNALIYEVDERPHNYKGVRELKVLMCEADHPFITSWCDHTQVMEIVHDTNVLRDLLNK